MIEILEVSCRKSDGWLGSLRVGELRFCTLQGQTMTPADFLDRIAGKRVLNFAHGYHTKECQADKTAETVAARIDQAGLGYDVLVLFSWAGGLTYAGFGMAVARTKACGAKLADLIALEVGRGAQVDCASHSLGAEVVAVALQTARSVGRWVALAAAIPDDSLAPGQKFDAAGLAVGSILVSYSVRDKVLQWAYPAGSGFKIALGLNGPCEILHVPPAPIKSRFTSDKVKSSNVSLSVGSHSEAYSEPAVYRAWKDWAGC